LRIKAIASQKGIEPEQALIDYTKKLDYDHEKLKEKMNTILLQRYGIGYKELERPGIQVKLK
jgi:hypothetical protein